eukprot:scaffold84242_cov14-Tisochrysis_lutea.AAC.1
MKIREAISELQLSVEGIGFCQPGRLPGPGLSSNASMTMLSEPVPPGAVLQAWGGQARHAGQVSFLWLAESYKQPQLGNPSKSFCSACMPSAKAANALGGLCWPFLLAGY